ncbi:MAG: transglutaminase-like domain-containing protein, partial [Planctomycetota bacterium]
TKLAFGWMPTSGGNRWSDTAARSGVGTGMQAIAAKDHAESFGAVESDILLESTAPTLYDMQNDQYGEPKKKAVSERRQALDEALVLDNHKQLSKTEYSNSAFNTERTKPSKKNESMSNQLSGSILQWDGDTGIRLAMQRYDSFDGSTWNQRADLSDHNLLGVKRGKDSWFFARDAYKHLRRAPSSASVGLLKILNLESVRIPVPMQTAGVHIKQIDAADFYGLSRDGSLYMPRRERIPPLTVIHVASMQILEDEILEHLRPREPRGNTKADGLPDDTGTAPHVDWKQNSSLAAEIQQLANTIRQDTSTPQDQINAICNHLRTHYQYDRNAGDDDGTSMATFFETKRGGDHLFASAATLVGRELGYDTRLVSGFYVRPDAFDVLEGYAGVKPTDVHFWTEVKLADGRWIEIEPTPGFVPPNYQPSLWLVAKRGAIAAFPYAIGLLVIGIILHLTRRRWIQWVTAGLWELSFLCTDRIRIRMAMGIITLRAWVVGARRRGGVSQRRWMREISGNDETLLPAATRFCDAAEAVCFGPRRCAAGDAPRRAVRAFSTSRLAHVAKETAV